MLDDTARSLLTRSHGVDARLTASVNGSAFVVPLTLEPGGTVKVDGNSTTRRTLDCTVIADLDTAAVDPYSVQLRAEYAVIDESSRRTWWEPVGTFVLTDAVEAGGGRVKLTGVDRWQRIIDARFERPTTTSGDTVAAIVDLIHGADESIPVDTSRARAGSHPPALWDRDRSEAITKLARSSGNEVFMDPLGVAVVQRVRSLGDPSVWSIGITEGARVSATRGVSRAAVYNAWSVKAEPQGAPPLYAVARVEGGPLRYGGPFGKRPRFYSTGLVDTQEQLQAMADSLRDRGQGVARTLDMVVLPNPELDAGHVVMAEAAPQVWQRHIVAGFTLPLGLDTVPLLTRTDAGEVDDGGA